MKTVLELRGFYNQTLVPDLLRLERQRKDAVKKFLIIAGVLVGVCVIGAIIVMGSEDGPGIFLGLGIFGVIVSYVYTTKGYVSDFKEVVIRKLIGFIDPGLCYNKSQYISEGEFVSSKLFLTKPDLYQGDDRVTGILGETKVDFSEIHAQYVTRDSKGRASYHTIFKGLFFKADFNKNFKGHTVVLPDTAERLLGSMGAMFQSWNTARPDLVKLEDPEFEKMFAVYGTDQIEARYILSPGLMKRIVDFKKKSGRSLYISFCAANIYIALSYWKDLFEPRVFKTLLDFQPIEQYFNDLELATGIVEDLNLNTRIWSKS